MATFNLVEGTNVGPSPRAPALSEAQLAQVMVNDHMGTGKCGMTVTYVYDNVARTLTCTFSGTAS